MFMTFIKELMGRPSTYPQLEDTHLTKLAQAHIPIQWDIRQIIMGQNPMHLPHAQGMYWTIQCIIKIPQVKGWAMPNMTTVTLKTSESYNLLIW